MPDATALVGPIVQIESLRSSGVPARLGTWFCTPCAAFVRSTRAWCRLICISRSSSGICSGPVAGPGPGTACSQSLAPRRTDRTTHTVRASAGEMAPTLGSDLIVWASCTPARICFNHQARRGTDTVSPRLLTDPFNRFGKLMATCFKRQIQTSADISPMFCEAVSLPHWSLVKVDRDSKVGVGRPSWRVQYLCPGVVWSGVARQRSIRNAIAHLSSSTGCACGQQLDATYGSKPLRCETHPLTRCVTCQYALPV